MKKDAKAAYITASGRGSAVGDISTEPQARADGSESSVE
eukprot:CAMPEP_0198199998 /NCGR_PEP_ID=MMETSP1445-20131203/3080_1 /TAXON_ID=36898 /ORGANISM="Pyramimonas sp., Strain CCMP2087" /LENGTH=38 /DNA_ID= /DNA_START= /DNA_END= /DNA_ORIENTATION=